MSLRPWIRSSLHTLSSLRTPRASRRRRTECRAASGPAAGGVRPHLSEPLEPRLLLTTITSAVGEEYLFDYAATPGVSVRVRVSGNISMELLGSSVSGKDNRARITNLPGRLTPVVPGTNAPVGPGIQFAGGPGGPGTIDVIGSVVSGAPTGTNPDINAIAADPVTGSVYAFDIQTIPIQNPPEGAPPFITNVFLIRLDFAAAPPGAPYGAGPGNTVPVTGVVVANLTAALQGAGQFAPVTVSIAAADFSPVNGLLYFVARSGEDGIDQMFTLDVNSGNIAGSVNLIPGIFQDSTEEGIQVAGITFDQTGPGTAQLIAVLGDEGGGAGGGGGGQAGQQTPVTADPARLVIVSPTNTNNFLGIIPFNDADPEPDDITVGGIEVMDDDPTQIDSLLLLGADEHWEVTRNDPVAPNGLLLELGPLVERPVQPGEPPLPPVAIWNPAVAGGTAVTFVPNIVDPFSQQLGAYIGFDASTDRLFFINRFESGNPEIPLTIYQIYIASSDATARIAISQYNPGDPQQPDTPFQQFRINQEAAALRIINAQNGQVADVAPGAAVGQVFIGAVSREVDPNDPDEDRRPLLEALVEPGVGLGLLPGATLPVDPQTGLQAVPAGITIASGDIDRFLIDGTVTGTVSAAGSINQMYVGWLLTGDARGEAQGAGPTRPQNFRVLGDLRDLYVLDSIGTDGLGGLGAPTDEPIYVTGFDLDVGGKLGHVRVGDSWLGNSSVVNHPDDTPGLALPQTEIETRTTNNNADVAWNTYQFSGNPIFFNDTFDTPQYLGSIASLGQADMVRVVGDLQHTDVEGLNDWVDYYAVALMAGQSVQVQMLSTFGPGLPYIGVFDPDARLVATDASDVLTTGYGEVFQVKADRPGIYRFAISMPLNFSFGNAQNDPSSIPSAPYELRITGVGDIGIGGISAVNHMLDVGPQFTIDASHTLEFGDLGALRAGGAMMSVDSGLASSATVRVNTGALRALDGGSIGRGTPTQLFAPVQVDVPAGDVGLVRARSGIMFFNASGSLEGRPAIGGNYQLVDAFSTAYVELIADGGLGILRAGSMGTNAPSTITVNFDDTGEDGIIDLIDVTGDFGSIVGGGPGITTNTGGNVRFMRIGGEVYADREFGGGFGTPIETIYEFGTVPLIKDDSGSTLEFIMSPVRRYVVQDDAGGEAEIVERSGRFGIRAYPIRGSGGLVVMDITAIDTFTIQGSGSNPDATGEIGRIIITPNTPAAGVVLDVSAGGPVFPNLADFQTGFEPINPGFGGEIGEPDYRRAPNPFILQPLPGQPGGGPAIAAGAIESSLVKQDLDIIINGTSTIDVWDIQVGDASAGQWAAFDGKLSSVQNNTRNGELINIRAASIGEIVSRGTIGMAPSHGIPGLTLNPLVYYEDFNTSGEEGNFPGSRTTGDSAGVQGYGNYYDNPMGQFPLIDVRYGVWVYGDLDENAGGTDVLTQRAGDLAEPGNVRSIRAGQGVGNIIVNGSIGELIPNADGTFEDEHFEGINGIVWARGHAEAAFYPNAGGRTTRPSYTNALEDRGGDIWFVDIGEGVAASGSGSAIGAGIYAGRRIELVYGENADIRGNIIAGDEWENGRNEIEIENPRQFANQVPPILFLDVPNILDFDDSIGRIHLRNGSIINANIGVVAGLYGTVEQSLRIEYVEDPSREAIDNPEFELGRVIVSGNGGIIGTSFQGADIGLIDVNGGFGIFTSELLLGGIGVLGGIEADNYGIRNVTGNVGGSMNFLNARGDGSSRSTVGFNPSIRRSELGFLGITPDPLSGMVANPLTDIHSVLGTNAATPEIPGRTDTGVIEDVDFRGQRDFGVVRAQQIRATNPDLLPSVLNFPNTFGSLIVRDQINGLRMTTGTFGNFRPAGDVFNLDLTVAGPLRNLVINGDLAEGSVIRTQGKVGNMGNIRILGRLDGDILSSGRIKRLFVAESISGNVSSKGGKGNAVGQLIIGGDIAEGGLNIQGNLGRLVLGGDFGRTGTDFTVQGRIGSLTIKGNLYSNVRAGTTLGKLNVGGSIFSGVRVEAQRIGAVRVGGDVQPDVIFRSRNQPKIRTGGQMLGDVELIP